MTINSPSWRLRGRGDLLAERMAELDGHASSHGGDVVGVLEAERPA